MEIQPGTELPVIKRNLAGEETWRYTGKVLTVQPNAITLEAYFNRADLPFHGLILGQGDRFVETFYTDRCYKICEMHAREDNHIKGWYCNVCEPAKLEADSLSYIDLALDLLVYPDGAQLVLDEDEFAALSLAASQRDQALAALEALQRHFADVLFNGRAAAAQEQG